MIVTNETDEAITITGVTSSSKPDGDPERNLNVTVAAGATERIDIGAEAAGSDNIFDNELNESATVYTSVGEITPSCEEAAGIAVGVDEGDDVTIDEDEQQDTHGDDQGDEQQGEMPEQMPENGAGGMAPTPFPVGNTLAGASVLLAAGYAGLRRR